MAWRRSVHSVLQNKPVDRTPSPRGARTVSNSRVVTHIYTSVNHAHLLHNPLPFAGAYPFVGAGRAKGSTGTFIGRVVCEGGAIKER